MNITKFNRYLTEETSDIKKVAELMTMQIMGNTKRAAKSLEKMLPLKQADFAPGKEYNNAFGQLYTDIDKAIRKALKSASGKYAGDE